VRGLRGLRRGSKQHQAARRELRNEKQRLKRALKQKILDEWTADQAVDDIESQLKGLGFAKHAVVDTSCHLQRPAQRRLVEALSAPLDDTLEGQYRRRDNAVDAIIAYCVVEEGHTVRRTDTSSTEPSQRPDTHDRDPPAGSPVYIAVMSVFVKTKKERPTRCFVCVGKALSLASNDPRVKDLIREFYSSGDLSKHFRRKHLSNLQDGEEIKCEVCIMQLDHEMHLQNHALRVHGTVS
jgi:hypothetical protein